MAVFLGASCISIRVCLLIISHILIMHNCALYVFPLKGVLIASFVIQAPLEERWTTFVVTSAAVALTIVSIVNMNLLR